MYRKKINPPVGAYNALNFGRRISIYDLRSLVNVPLFPHLSLSLSRSYTDREYIRVLSSRNGFHLSSGRIRWNTFFTVLNVSEK